MLQRLIMQLKIKCTNEEFGCPWVNSLDNLEVIDLITGYYPALLINNYCSPLDIILLNDILFYSICSLCNIFSTTSSLFFKISRNNRQAKDFLICFQIFIFFFFFRQVHYFSTFFIYLFVNQVH